MGTEEGHDFSPGVVVQLSTIDWFVYALIIAAPLQIIASSSKYMSSVFIVEIHSVRRRPRPLPSLSSLMDSFHGLIFTTSLLT